MTRRNLITLCLSVTGACLGTTIAQKAAGPKTQDKHSLAEEHTKELLLLMDTDKNGKVSKQEWMKFMEAEFDRLDKNKKGELDPQELGQSKVRLSGERFTAVGK